MKDPLRRSNPVLAVIGLLLLAAGGYGLARSYGAFGADRADEPVLGDGVRGFVARNEGWFWPAAVVLAVLVAYLGWRWLRHQLGGDRVTRLDVSARAGGHPTYVHATAAAAALSRDVETYDGVRSVRTRVLSDGARPQVALTVDVDDDADVTTVSTRIDGHALPRFRQALEVEHLATSVRFRFVAPSARH
ncbi:MAG TPA: hypothetical protein VHM89_16410 [Acidimicrobiales bacterium]|nr:hypothetical protein [Acidimicrobiales bacterium]